MKLENFKSTANNDKFYEENADGATFSEEHMADDFEELYGVENEYTRELKEKIDKSK